MISLPSLAQARRAAAHLVQQVPDGGARLVQRGDDSVAQRGQARHVVHDVQRRERVQACAHAPERGASASAHRHACPMRAALYV